MKKKAMSLILALILLLSCSATAQAISVQAATPSASITINGTTATCRVSIAKPGKSIHATLQLWQGSTMLDSWSGSGTSYLLVTGSHKVALVSVTVSQQNSPAEGFPLTELSLYTTDMLMNMDWDLLGVVNPILDGATGIRLQDGASCDILLPFDLYRYRFTSAEWNRLEQSNIWLQVTNYPTRKIVRVNIGEE